MEAKSWTPRLAVLVAGAAFATSVSIVTCGSASANPIEELLEIVGRQVAQDLRIPATVATRDSTAVLGPATRAAAGNESEFLRIKKAGCTANTLGLTIGGIENFYASYSDSERDAIKQQSDRLANSAPALVAILCSFKS